MKCVAIGGEPATGKTTLVKEILKDQQMQDYKFGLLRGHLLESLNLLVLGIYNNDTFCGTDKLSMAVNSHFLKFLQITKRNFLFEGDRLFSKNNLEYINKLHETKVLILENDKKTLDNRHLSRKDNQSEIFKKGRKTKILNIKNHIPHQLHTLSNINDIILLKKDILKFFN